MPKSRALSQSEIVDPVQLESMMRNINNELFDKIEKRLKKFENKLNKIKGNLDILKEKIHLQETKFLANEKKVEQLDLMQRKNTLKFEGLADEEDEYLLDKILKLINQGMKVKCEERYINEMYRLGKSKKNENPRSVIVKFVTYIERKEV
ncbi:unnamed protein product [Psylliodes chrysocephalus]|uniref:Uncharacterized protein n=1 Tax=Psylliodes chrysocephalus TaxID=3402493 RepID=A0A9P0GIE7_9CUCU|nr:unnamed protein product [Psylliodes chrysocephala]